MVYFRAERGISGKSRTAEISSFCPQVNILRVSRQWRAVGHQQLHVDNQYIAVQTSEADFSNKTKLFGIYALKRSRDVQSTVSSASRFHHNSNVFCVSPVLKLAIGCPDFNHTYLVCPRDLRKLVRYLWLHAYQGETRTVEEALKLRIHLRSNLDVPDLFTNETALEKIVLDVVLLWLGL